MSAKSITQPRARRRPGPRRGSRPGRSGRAGGRTCARRARCGSRWAASKRELLEDLGDAHRMPSDLVGLEAQPPLGMVQAVGDRQLRCSRSTLGAVHRLQEEVVEVAVARSARAAPPSCGIDELQLVAASEHGLGPGLRADADPVESRRAASSVPLVSTAISKPPACSASISVGVELQQRLAAGADDEAAGPAVGAAGQCAATRAGQVVGGAELAAAGAVGADEVGVAEPADRASRGPPRGPVHRLQPAKRQNTAGRPALAPSPCSV